MSNTDNDPLTRLTSQHDAYTDALRKGQESNQLFVVLELIRQIQISQPDKATVQSTFNLISQILPALGNVASKKDLEHLSHRIGTIENEIGRISQTSSLNDRDVQQLKEGQTTIKDSLRIEAGRLEKAGESTGSDIKDLRRSIETLSLEVGKVRAENRQHLLSSVLTIILFVVAVATFFFKPAQTSQPSSSQTAGGSPINSGTPAAAPPPQVVSSSPTTSSPSP